MSGQEQKAASEASENVQSGQPIQPRAVKPMSGADFITAIVLIIFGTAFFKNARNMRTYRIFFSSPGFFPMILGIIFILFGLALLYISYRRGGWVDARRIIGADNLKRSVASPVFKKCVIIFLLILGYVALLGKISFVYLSMGYLFLTFLFLKAAKWYWIALISVIAPIVIQMVFVNYFRIPMP
ncbi:MAG: tripartite tricarboxylate transporter TctB family protein [Synergistaceae bacterium]|nr:tripartite tricarboxylate transporter TctB family protein [Synergistaceae bacterium]